MRSNFRPGLVRSQRLQERWPWPTGRPLEEAAVAAARIAAKRVLESRQRHRHQMRQRLQGRFRRPLPLGPRKGLRRASRQPRRGRKAWLPLGVPKAAMGRAMARRAARVLRAAAAETGTRLSRTRRELRRTSQLRLRRLRRLWRLRRPVPTGWLLRQLADEGHSTRRRLGRPLPCPLQLRLPIPSAGPRGLRHWLLPWIL
mmetsp:Transcript_72819/g.158073  ORF Transcript_72819/g.158073 Transcript_72819/m.158073 type:complete len:200 (+) Transcript_72819:1034-1633(+)